VEIGRADSGCLVLEYRVSGRIADIELPPLTEASRGDELWKHTCVEAFVGASSRNGYYEFNWAPSQQWAAYQFNGYRSGKRVLSEISDIRFDVEAMTDRFTLRTSLRMDQLTDLPRNAPWRLGLSAVIEDRQGRLSYWALAHPPGKPDFHHEACFAHDFDPDARP